MNGDLDDQFRYGVLRGSSRRRVLKLVGVGMCAAATGVLGARGRDLGRVLRLYTWPDYFKPELLEAFAREHGCGVEVSEFRSNEELFSNLDQAAHGYDLLTPSSYMVAILRRMAKLMPLDGRLLPHRRHVDPVYLQKASDPEMAYSVPFELSVSGLAFMRGAGRPEARSWRLLETRSVRGRFTLMDDMREVLGAALKTLGHSVNSRDPAEIAAAARVALGWKCAMRRFEDRTCRFNLLAGEDLYAHWYSGSVVAGASADEQLEFFVPEEGAPMACDDFCIPAGAREKELAHAFIDFFCRPQNAGANMEWSGFRAPIPEAVELLAPEIKGNRVMFPDASVLRVCETLADVGDALLAWETAWEEVLRG